MGSWKHSKALAACLGITTCTSCFPFEPTEVSAFYFVTPYNQVREQTLVGAPWDNCDHRTSQLACNKHTKTSNFRRCPAFPPEEESSAPPTSRHDDASVHPASSQTSRKADPRETEAPDLLEHHISSLRFESSFIVHLQKSKRISRPELSLSLSLSLCPEKNLTDYRRSRITSRAAEDEGEPTGCRGVTPDGIYEAARKATDEI
ncbi:hypothetical protein ALC56_13241 [Trachymyrmex septentrionalis]|uniref:Uncharacterized protein n=1 Tax=Trachymyrmex septentrionalis TaxID=34720 RepID=A0A195EWX6_9HYME|nr:hypothetical protein ALC56_13241 [Trachymyrmex septentrionalis]